MKIAALNNNRQFPSARKSVFRILPEIHRVELAKSYLINTNFESEKKFD